MTGDFNFKKILDQINNVLLKSNRSNYLNNINNSGISDTFFLYKKLNDTEIIQATQGKYFLTVTFFGTNKVYLVTQLDNFNGLSEKKELSRFNNRPEFDEFLLKTESVETPKYSEYMCFNTFTGIDNEIDCKTANGIWDHPVIDSTECPFYSTGYLATNGFCSVPPEYSLLGYRNYILKSKEN